MIRPTSVRRCTGGSSRPGRGSRRPAKLESASAQLAALLPLEGELGQVLIRLEVLADWMYTLLLEKNLHYPRDLGSDSDKHRWYDALTRLRASLAQAYAQPGQADLTTLRKQWAWQLDDLYQDMKRVGGTSSSSASP